MSRLGRVDAIVAEELQKRYGTVQALEGVSFGVHEGEVFGVAAVTASFATWCFRAYQRSI